MIIKSANRVNALETRTEMLPALPRSPVGTAAEAGAEPSSRPPLVGAAITC